MRNREETLKAELCAIKIFYQTTVMNKSLLSVLSLLAVAGAVSAQANFKLTKTSYVGAFSSDASADWTQGWTNFDPKTTAYAAVNDTTTLNGMVSSLPVVGEKILSGTVTLDATKTYLLKGIIVVPAGAKLVVPAGTVIRGLANISTTPKNYATIVVERGGQIELNGTSTMPVVFTSANAAGSRERGDWGGIVVAGKAKHNLSNANFDNVQMEGFNNVSFDATLARFGGNDAADNSGVVTYVRIEFAGLAFETNKEVNALTLGAVGSGTELHHVQVSFSGDDSFEWFGGSVNSHHLIAYKGTDDDFDTDNGYNGISQFGLAVRDTSYYDLTYSLAQGSSTSEGFESDNEATGTASVQPYTNAIFSNYTMVGPVPVGSTYSQMSGTVKSAFRRGARIRRNSSLRIANSIFMGYRNFVMIDGDSSVRNTNYPAALALVSPSAPVDIQNKQIFFTNNLIVNTAAALTSTTDTTANGLCEVARAKGSLNKRNAIDSWLRQTVVAALSNNINPVAFTAGTLLVNPSAYTTTPDFKPVAGSPALSGANFDTNPVLVNISTDVEEVAAAAQFAPIYPNPTRGGIINFGREVVSYGIFDISGRLVSYGLDTDHANIDTLTTGVYFIKLDGAMQKLVIE